MTSFETETMADLLWQQGHADDALALCARLAARAHDDERSRLNDKAAVWRARLADGGASPPRARAEAAVHAPPSVELALTPGGLVLSWSLPPSSTDAWSTTPSQTRAAIPCAELFIVRVTRPGGELDVQRRTLPLGALAGSLKLPVSELHSARAAAGFLETNTFHPLARSALLKGAQSASES